jgi:uncharacterized membrane protein SirB2
MCCSQCLSLSRGRQRQFELQATLNIVPLLKTVHVASVITSYSLFVLRGFWQLRGTAMIGKNWARIVPHCVDSALLFSAIALAWQLGYTPANSPWLATKIVALLIYIGIGMLAFRFAKTYRLRLFAYLAAQLVFFYIIAVAITHDPYLITWLITWLIT